MIKAIFLIFCGMLLQVNAYALTLTNNSGEALYLQLGDSPYNTCSIAPGRLESNQTAVLTVSCPKATYLKFNKIVSGRPQQAGECFNYPKPTDITSKSYTIIANGAWSICKE